MKLAFLCCAAALAFAGPTAQDHRAILGPEFAKGTAGDPVAQQVITRAEAALARPPGAIPQLHTEGTLPGKGIREISLKAKEDQPIILNLALAWRLTGDRRFLDQAGRYLETWADIYQMSFNPIDETGFDSLILATDLTEADLPPALRAKLDAFWRRMAEGYLDAMRGKPKHFYTNWQSHRVKLATMAAFQIGDPDLIARARQAFQAQVATNILANGSVFDFLERDALHYVTYDLDPLLMAAIAAKAHGEDWYAWKNPAGASLRSALAWLEPYARGEKSHIEFARSTIQFDLDRAKAGQDEYAPHPWDAGNAVGTYALAAQIDPGYKSLSSQLQDRTGRKPQAWLELLAD
ncbi:alginate lyase family protein [Sphingomonas sp. JC676]|uniref:alginate lyase family protein n=1 Tax=Sphingomonas sp. JC676 TaxID=2768065 RepID=UPI0016585E0C|nr:alginate lyase family protein [Sphingomonas sp. JC676]MBC9032206.1 alginate lyase family protein [Sphingomonas sp. JC676]